MEQDLTDTEASPMNGSNKEETLIRELKSRIFTEFPGQEFPGLSHNGGIETSLRRFLVARDWNLEKAFTMLQASILWRKQVHADTALHRDILPKKKLDMIRQCLPQGMHGVDRGGRPVWIERAGYMEIDSLLEAGVTIEDVMQYHFQQQEYTQQICLPRQSQMAGKPVTKLTIIHDLSNAGRHIFRKLVFQFIKQSSSMDQDNYPDIVHQIILVNAPVLFSGAWKIIEGFLNPETAAKVRILGKNYQKELQEAVDPSQLPAFLGGKCECSSGHPHGGCLSSKDFLQTKYITEYDECLKNNIVQASDLQ